MIYAFDRPMQPGEARRIDFHTVWEQRGFRNNGNLTRIVDNGTYADDRKTLAYRLGESLSSMTDHYLLMTATPHKGDAENFCAERG